MEGLEIARLMNNRDLKSRLATHARRYSSVIEDQEEYIQDAWLRISTLNADMENEYYGEQGRKAMKATYDRRRYHVRKEKPRNPNGISVTEKDIKKKIPDRAIRLERNKYFDPTHEMLDWQFYKGQEDELRLKGERELEWYKRYEGYEHLPRREQRRIDNKFRNSGFTVGKPIGMTRGVETKFYNIMVDYSVINGVVAPIRVPHVKDNVTRVVGGGTTPVILDTWRALRKLGGSEKWLKWLDDTISGFESLLNNKGIE